MTLAMAMVALDQSAEICAEEIPKSWGKRWPESSGPIGETQQDDVLSFQLGEFSITYGVMPAPIPSPDHLEALCRNARFWPGAWAEMQKHQRHVIVTVAGPDKPIEALQVLTQATVALLDACKGAIGVFWYHSLLLFPPQNFCEIACQFVPRFPPLPIWVNFVFSQQEDGSVQGATKGLSALGLMEFETVNSPEPPEEIQARLHGLAVYVIENGRVIQDGDTIGESAQERIKVTYGPSAFGNEGDVMRLDYRAGDEAPLKVTSYGCWHALATLACTIGFGWWLYSVFPIFRESFLRHFLILPLVAIFGFVLLLVSDRLLQKALGLQAFETPPKSA